MSERFKQIEESIIELCKRCQDGECMSRSTTPVCKRYPEMKCAAIYVLDQMTAKDAYTDVMTKHIEKNVELLEDAIVADFG